MGHRLSRREHVGYALGSLGTGGFGTVPGLLLLYYLTDTLAVPAALAGVVVLAPKVWDVAVDPLLGTLSDRSAVRRGSRRPFLLFGAVSLPIFFAATFAVPAGFTPRAAAAWVAAAFVLAVTAFSVFQVSYLAMPAEITDDYHERTSLMSWRVAFLAVAILLFGAGAPELTAAGGGAHEGYRLMGVVVGAALGAGMLGAWWLTRHTVAVVHGEVETAWRAQLRAVRENRPFAMLLAAFILQALATGCMLAAAPYVATYVLDDSTLTTVLFVSLVGPALLVMPLWARIGGRFDKRRGFLSASVVFGLATAGLVAMPGLPQIAVFGLVGLVGVAYAGMQMFPLAMMPDAIAAEAATSGRRRAGLFTGIWTAGETTGLALGPGLLALVLAITGFVSSRGGEQVTQPESAVLGVVVGFSMLPALLLAGSLPFILRYDLSAERLAGLSPIPPRPIDPEEMVR